MRVDKLEKNILSMNGNITMTMMSIMMIIQVTENQEMRLMIGQSIKNDVGLDNELEFHVQVELIPKGDRP